MASISVVSCENLCIAAAEKREERKGTQRHGQKKTGKERERGQERGSVARWSV